MTRRSEGAREVSLRARVVRTVSTRGVTLAVSGVPTIVAWTWMARLLPTTSFAAVSLALSIPTVMNFILPALGMRIANAVPQGERQLAEAISDSLAANLRLAVFLPVASVFIEVVFGWNDLLSVPRSVPMGAPMVVSSVVMGIWVASLTGERVLIALDRNVERLWSLALTGPVTLAGVAILAMQPSRSPLLFVLPVTGGMVISGMTALWRSTRNSSPFRPTRIWREVVRKTVSLPRRGQSRDVLWILIAEAAWSVSFWLLRPLLSARGDLEGVADLSLVLQYASPVLSIIAATGQSFIPHYVELRQHLTRRRVLHEILLASTLGLMAGVLWVTALLLGEHANLLGRSLPVPMLIATGIYLVARTVWQPARILFSTPATALRLAIVSLVAAPLGLTFGVTVGANLGLVGAATSATVATFFACWWITPRAASPASGPVRASASEHH